MKKIRSFVKRLPFIGFFFVKVKNNLKQIPSIAGKGNIIENKGSFNDVKFDIIGNNNLITVGINTSINHALIYIRGNDHTISFGENCYFGEGELWIEDEKGSIIIHNHTTIERGHIAVTEPGSKIEIMQDCMLAKHVEIRTGDSHSIIDMQSGERINKAANVTLKEHVWVGAHAKILKGVTIGNNSVIGTSALVTKDVPSHSIAAGIPAKVIRDNINWKRERIIE
jgi:acetyltransferase-like isoleucine patch superfamily enzyme